MWPNPVFQSDLGGKRASVRDQPHSLSFLCSWVCGGSLQLFDVPWLCCRLVVVDAWSLICFSLRLYRVVLSPFSPIFTWRLGRYGGNKRIRRTGLWRKHLWLWSFRHQSVIVAKCCLKKKKKRQKKLDSDSQTVNNDAMVPPLHHFIGYVTSLTAASQLSSSKRHQMFMVKGIFVFLHTEDWKIVCS